MKVGSLRVFLAIYETGSVSVASRTLGISQSGASAALGRLRESFGDELFVKTLRGMEPTARAHAIAGPTRRLVEAADQIEAPEAEFQPLVCDDEFRLVAGDILEGTVLLMLAQAFQKQAPSARLRSLSLGRHELEEAMASGHLDACLGYLPNLGPNIHQTTVAKFTFACFCNPSHPLAGKKITEAEFASAKYVLMDADSSLPNIIEEWLRAQRIPRNVVVRTAHFHAIPRMVSQSDLIAIIPTDIGRNWLFDGDVRRIELPFSPPCLELKVYWHRAFHHDPRNRWFRRLIIDGLRNETQTLRQRMLAARKAVAISGT